MQSETEESHNEYANKVIINPRTSGLRRTRRRTRRQTRLQRTKGVVEGWRCCEAMGGKRAGGGGKPVSSQPQQRQHNTNNCRVATDPPYQFILSLPRADACTTCPCRCQTVSQSFPQKTGQKPACSQNPYFSRD